MRSPTERIARDALFTGFSLMLAYLETLIPLPFFFAFPGVRLGLPNICVMLVFFKIGKKDAFAVLILRIFLSVLLFSSPVTAIYSLAGGLCAYGTMAFLANGEKKGVFSFYGISSACAASHITGQIAVASAIYASPAFFTYLPGALLLSLLTGLLTGGVTSLLAKKISRFLKND